MIFGELVTVLKEIKEELKGIRLGLEILVDKKLIKEDEDFIIDYKESNPIEIEKEQGYKQAELIDEQAEENAIRLIQDRFKARV